MAHRCFADSGLEEEDRREKKAAQVFTVLERY